MSKLITIVDKFDKPIGSADLLEAYEKGLRHRVARIFLFNSKGELFLQKRGPHMRTAPNKWDNSAGGVVDEGEDYETAALREAKEEIGLTGLQLKETLSYYIEAKYPGTFLRRFNTLFIAKSDKKPIIDKQEVVDGKWVSLPDLEKLISENREDFSDSLVKTLELYRALERK